VLELRNISDHWPGAGWSDETRLRPYVELAYRAVRRPG
jgi:hypothetical protein